MGMAALRRIILNFILLLASLAASLMVAEAVLRVVLHPGDYLAATLRADPVLGHVIEPHTSGHDAWGFRNREVPPAASIVGIGDSQTYGVMASLRNSWPYQLQELSGLSVYNLALGGYGPLEYLHLLRERALSLDPEVVVVGLYSGNDLVDAHRAAASRPHWRQFRQPTDPPVPSTERRPAQTPQQYFSGIRATLRRNSVLYGLLSLYVAPMVRFTEARRLAARTTPDHQLVWIDPIDRGVRTVFTPLRRLNQLHMETEIPRSGLRITMDAFSAMQSVTQNADVRLLVVFIPTKEFVYCPYVIESGQTLPPAFRSLCEEEARLEARLKALFQESGIEFLSAVTPLRKLVQRHEQIYPRDTDGHPTARGYRAIATAIGDVITHRRAADEYHRRGR